MVLRRSPPVILSVLLILRQWRVCGGARPAVRVPFSVMTPMEPPDETLNKETAYAYAKYDTYPPYCSTPDEMEKRAVPPLSRGNGSAGSAKLVHVTALIRHGARTPYAGAPAYQCWGGYWDDEETGIWNCDLKTYVSPPATTKEKGRAQAQVLADNGLLEEEPDFLFEKRFDALAISANKTNNNLNGTCQLGQLLMRGYDQELRNGLHLRQAYVYDGDEDESDSRIDSRMRLWDLTREGEETEKSSTVVGDPRKQIYQEPNLRYRADDKQRTLMSGQVLLRGLFEPELLSSSDDEAAVIRLHTADYQQDVLEINGRVCPRVDDLRNEAYASDEYQKWTKTSAEVKAVTAFAKEELGMEGDSNLDCLMTTICTDRTLPPSINDYDGSLGSTPWEDSLKMSDVGEGKNEDANNMFERLANFAVKNFTFPYKYNNAAYSKLGMGPLVKEIMANILPIVDSANYPPSGTPPPKLALFSGHDTTLMPILATMGDKVWSGTEWAPYASMIIIEVYEISKDGEEDEEFASGYGFRLIYNGKVLTTQMDGCSSEICDSQVLVKQVMPFAKYQERDCAASVTPDNAMKEMKEAAESLLVAPGGVWVMLSLILVSMIVGCVLTVFWMKHKMHKTLAYRQESIRVVVDDDPGIDLSTSAKYGATSGETTFDENALI